MSMFRLCALGVSAALLAAAASAEDTWRHGERQPLWPDVGRIPDFQKHQYAEMSDLAGVKGFRREDHRMPYAEWFEKPANPNGACMILFSGGSYNGCTNVSLIKKWRDRFTELGYQTVNVVYRVWRPEKLPCHYSAWQDGQRAVRLVRSQAAARGFDPEKIGVAGMSAGGHLVTLLATSALTPAYAPVDALDEVPCHANWCVAFAPAYATLNGVKGVPTPQDGTTETACLSPYFKFDAKTCPTVFLHGAADTYSPNASSLCWQELTKRGVPSELHVYAGRGHAAHGLERAVEFMSQMAFVKEPPPEVAFNGRFPPADTAGTEAECLWPDAADARIVWFMPAKRTAKAVLVVLSAAGGAEVTGSAARWLNGNGMTAAVAEFPQGSNARRDAQRAIRLVRAGAERRGLDPERIGIVGFGADGDLAFATAASTRTPAYAPVDSIDGRSAKLKWAVVVGARFEDAGKTALDADTPPMSLMCGGEDVASAMGAVKTWEALRKAGIQSDLHVYARRGRGFYASGAPGTGSFTWPDRVWKFLTTSR